MGFAGEAVEVSRGFARNYLIPQRLAVPVQRVRVRGPVAEVQEEAATTAQRREEVMDEATEAKEAVKNLVSSPLV